MPSWTPINSEALPTYLARLDQVSGDASRQWGKLTAAQMMAHVRLMIQVALEEASIPSKPVPLGRTRLLRWLALALPWPKGAPAPPNVFPEADPNLATEKRLLSEALRRFAAEATARPRRVTTSPFLGPTDMLYWSKINGKHLDHHLRQFGA